MQRYKFDAEKLAYWYLRLNGFLTIENFILHADVGSRDPQQRTDLDLIAFRFPHRREALRHYNDNPEWMEDDPRFAKKEVPFGAFVEITIGRCKLNGPWTDRKKDNMSRALRASGALRDQEVKRASDGLYNTGRYRDEDLELGLISLGGDRNTELNSDMPGVEQILWGEVKDFIFDRFEKYQRIKREHPQWDLHGHLLWKAFRDSRGDKRRFSSSFELVTDRPTREEIEAYCSSRSIAR